MTVSTRNRARACAQQSASAAALASTPSKIPKLTALLDREDSPPSSSSTKRNIESVMSSGVKERRAALLEYRAAAGGGSSTSIAATAATTRPSTAGATTSAANTSSMMNRPRPKKPAARTAALKEDVYKKAAVTTVETSPRRLPATPKPNNSSKEDVQTQQDTKRIPRKPVPTTAAASPRPTVKPAGQRPQVPKHEIPPRMTSPTFEFSFKRQDVDLSEEAQKIMDSVREEAAKIKSQMLEQRDKQDRLDAEAEGGRVPSVASTVVRRPQRRPGRFSDAHRQQFRRMESIAQDRSLWKSTSSSPLKRNRSKDNIGTPKSAPRPKSTFLWSSPSKETLDAETPSKRTKRSQGEDVSDAKQKEPARTPRKLTKKPSTAMTPTKTSLARSESAKSLKTVIPALTKSASTLTKSASTRTLKPSASADEGNSWAKFSDNVKSMLRPSPSKNFNESTDSVHDEIRALPPPPLPPGSSMDVNKQLPRLPWTPTIKCVEPSVTSKYQVPISMPRDEEVVEVDEEDEVILEADEMEDADVKQPTGAVTYPNLDPLTNIFNRIKSPKFAKSRNGPTDFTFRAEQTIEFRDTSVFTPNARALSPTSTIRTVRPSGIPTLLDDTSRNAAKRSFFGFKSHAHGLNNKKRKHVASDDSDTEISPLSERKRARHPENEENIDPLYPTLPKYTDKTSTEDDSHRNKKMKMQQQPKSFSSPLKKPLGTPVSARKVGTLGSASPSKRRGGISLGRLNVLARPKYRG